MLNMKEFGKRVQAIREQVLEMSQSELAEKINKSAEKIGKKAKIHIKIDTGMGRIGFQPDENGIDDIISISRLPFIDLEGIFTHFALKTSETDKEQYDLFINLISKLESNGINIPIKHICFF